MPCACRVVARLPPVEVCAVDDHLAGDERDAGLIERKRRWREAPPGVGRWVVRGSVSRDGAARRVTPDQELLPRPRPPRGHTCRDRSRGDLGPRARSRVERGAVTEHAPARRPVSAPHDEPGARPSGGCGAAAGDRRRRDSLPTPRARVVQRAVIRVGAVSRGSAPDDQASTGPDAHASTASERRIGQTSPTARVSPRDPFHRGARGTLGEQTRGPEQRAQPEQWRLA